MFSSAAVSSFRAQALPRVATPIAHSTARLVVLATSDAALGQATLAELQALRWTVQEARGGAGMLALLERELPAACLIDSSFADLDARECVREIQAMYPEVDVLTLDGADLGAQPPKGRFRAELLHALRSAQAKLDTPAWEASLSEEQILRRHAPVAPAAEKASFFHNATVSLRAGSAKESSGASEANVGMPGPTSSQAMLPEFIGSDPRLQEVSRRIQLVAGRKTTVLVHGATGTGKELVARALHRLSGRAKGRFVAINCAAIPEALVEAELFGHARGAFTGAQQARVGRIEAAAGGTLFLDEIGELPLGVQGKLLRFLESGAIQRVGENEEVRVDVRVVAATHRKLGAMAREGSFRLDLLHRLSVFLIQTPELAGRPADIDTLAAHFLEVLREGGSPKRLSPEARAALHAHAWPGNVRELQHTLERAWILAGSGPVLDEHCIDFGEALL